MKNKTIIFSVLLILLSISVFVINKNYSSVSNRYWVGGTGNWNSTTHWSTTSGGTGGASIPTSSDNVIFDNNSSTSNYTVNMIDGLFCNDLTIGAPASGKVSISYPTPYKNLTISGSLSIPAGTAGFNYVGFTAYLTFDGGSCTISTNNVSLYNAGFIFNGGGTYQLIDNLNIRDVQCTLSLISGVFDTNGKRVNIYFTQFIKIFGSFDFSNLNLSSGDFTDTYVELNNNLSCDTLSIKGLSKQFRILIRSNAQAVSKTITSSNVIFKNVDFQDITASWNLSSIIGGSGDCGGNSGITFTYPKNVYWFRGTGNFSDTTKWFAASGGVPGGGVKSYFLPQDTIIFDSNSFSTNNNIVNEDEPRIPTMKWISVTNNPTLNTNTQAHLFGNLQLSPNMFTTGMGAFNFNLRSSSTLKTNGTIINENMVMDAIGGSLSILDNLTSIGSLNLINGQINDNNNNVSVGGFISSNSNSRTFNMGTSTWTLTGKDGITKTWDLGNTTNLTFSSIGNINITNTTLNQKSFIGGGLTYNIINFNGDNILIQNNNTFSDININNAGYTRGLKFTSGTTQSITNMSDNGSSGSLCKISSSIAGSAFSLSKSSGTVSLDYMSIKDSEATGGATWNAGSHSVDISNNTGWIF